MATAIVGRRYQIVIPLRERRKVGLKAMEKVEVHAEGGRLTIVPSRQRTWPGIGRELADGTDATDYVKRLRAEWKRRA
jgi:AbrB family looped-hinge helix DNA binding protein